MTGLTDATAAVLRKIERLECLRPYLLVGGTALTMQLGTRQSEDLDFMRWSARRGVAVEVDWPAVKRELEEVATVDRVEVLGFDHVEFEVEGVKVSFYARAAHCPVTSIVPGPGLVRLADVGSIGVMKVELLLRRANFRDYYDIYCIVRSGVRLKQLIAGAGVYSGHRLKSRQAVALLLNSAPFVRGADFDLLKPAYDAGPAEIADFLRAALATEG